MAAEVNLIRDLLDKQLVGDDGLRMGRIDGITLEVGDGQPRVIDLRVGGSEVWSRIGHRFEKLARALRRHVGPSSAAPHRIPWSEVHTTGRVVRVTVPAAGSAATRWERWMERHLIAKIPGSAAK